MDKQITINVPDYVYDLLEKEMKKGFKLDDIVSGAISQSITDYRPLIQNLTTREFYIEDESGENGEGIPVFFDYEDASGYLYLKKGTTEDLIEILQKNNKFIYVKIGNEKPIGVEIDLYEYVSDETDLLLKKKPQPRKFSQAAIVFTPKFALI